MVKHWRQRYLERIWKFAWKMLEWLTLPLERCPAMEEARLGFSATIRTVGGILYKSRIVVPHNMMIRCYISSTLAGKLKQDCMSLCP